MIEIIKYPNRKYLGQCQCGCEFTFEDEDMKVEKEERYWHDPIQPAITTITRKYITCPCCEIDIEFKKGKFEELFKGE